MQMTGWLQPFKSCKMNDLHFNFNWKIPGYSLSPSLCKADFDYCHFQIAHSSDDTNCQFEVGWSCLDFLLAFFRCFLWLDRSIKSCTTSCNLIVYLSLKYSNFMLENVLFNASFPNRLPASVFCFVDFLLIKTDSSSVTSW